MAKTIKVVCKLPTGIIIEHPQDPSKTVALRGKNTATIVGSDHGETEVDIDFWESWIAVNKDFPAVISGAIFAAEKTVDVTAKVKEFKGRETGFEPMRTDGKDPRAKGVTNANKKKKGSG